MLTSVRCLLSIVLGFGCKVICYDKFETDEVRKMGGTYVPLDQVFKESDIISIHAPLTDETKHIINDDAISKMKDVCTSLFVL